MILKLFFMQTSYCILLKAFVSSYVLFAANIDDFKGIANKIIPGYLEEQFADSSDPKISYHLDGNHEDEGNDKNSDYDSQNEDAKDSTEDSSTSDVQKPYLKAKDEISKKVYQINNQNIDLDELVKRVKEKLEAEYKIASKVEIEDVTSKTVKGIEDYYYKDATLNQDFSEKDTSEQIEKAPVLTYSIESPIHSPDFEGDQYNYKNPHKNRYMPKKTPEKIKYLKEKESKQVISTYEYNERTTRYLDAFFNNKDVTYGQNVKENSEYVEYDAKNTKINGKKLTDASYEDSAKESENVPPAAIGEFKQIDMLQSNDSYEDYVTPKRDDIFESSEETTKKRFRQIRPLANVQKFSADNNQDKVDAVKIKLQNPSDYESPSEIPMKSQSPREVKGRTASMWFKDPKIENYDEFTKNIKEKKANKPTTKRMRTMFPTRSHVKFSSPNYLAKLPVVAEKYNFDEPIPEKDREPEEIKYIKNPPARINKKVKVRK